MATAVKIIGTALGTVEFDTNEVGEGSTADAAEYEVQRNAISDVHLEQYGEDKTQIQIEFILHYSTTLAKLQSIAAAEEELDVYPHMIRDDSDTTTCVLLNPEAVGEACIWGKAQAMRSIGLTFLEQYTP